MKNRYSAVMIISILGICFTQALSYYVLNIRDNSIYKMMMINPDGSVEDAPENKLTKFLLHFAESSGKISLALGVLAFLALVRSIIQAKRGISGE